MDVLSDDAIIEILSNISDFDDLQNLCKSSKRIKTLCKANKQSICKAFLKNNGFTNFSGILESPCKLMLQLRNFPPESLTTQAIKKMIGKSDPFVRFLSINGKIDNRLYHICEDLIEKNLIIPLKKLYETTGYSFNTPFGFNSLISIAAFWANQYDDIDVLKYILENGGQQKIKQTDIRLLKLTSERHPQINKFLK